MWVRTSQLPTKSTIDQNERSVVFDPNSNSTLWQEVSVYTARANHTWTQTANTISDFQAQVSANTDLIGKQDLSEKGVADGYCPLDSATKIPLVYIPESIVGWLNYLWAWDANTNTPTITSGVGTNWDFYSVSVAWTTNIDGISVWNVWDLIIFDWTVNRREKIELSGNNITIIAGTNIAVDNTDPLNPIVSTVTNPSFVGVTTWALVSNWPSQFNAWLNVAVWNIVVAGTVDWRDVSNDWIKLDTIDTWASSYWSNKTTIYNTTIQTTNSLTFQNRDTITYNVPSAANYILEINYSWNHNQVNNDFEAEIVFNWWRLPWSAAALNSVWAGTLIHKQEPKDVGWNIWWTWSWQVLPFTKKVLLSLTAWVNTIALQFRTDNVAWNSSILESFMSLYLDDTP